MHAVARNSAPEASDRGQDAPAVSLDHLKKRPDFLAANRGRRAAMPGFVLLAYRRPAKPAAGTRFGITCSKKVGNSVARNRAKRRLREIARACFPQLGRDGWDYVLIGRPEVTANRDFRTLTEDLRTALRKVHAP